MFWQSFTNYLTACYVAVIHSMAFFGCLTVYYYYYEPLQLCKKVTPLLLWPFGGKG